MYKFGLWTLVDLVKADTDSDLVIHTKFKHFTDKYKKNGRQRKDHTVISVSCHPTKG